MILMIDKDIITIYFIFSKLLQKNKIGKLYLVAFLYQKRYNTWVRYFNRCFFVGLYIIKRFMKVVNKWRLGIF